MRSKPYLFTFSHTRNVKREVLVPAHKNCHLEHVCESGMSEKRCRLSVVCWQNISWTKHRTEPKFSGNLLDNLSENIYWILGDIGQFGLSTPSAVQSDPILYISQLLLTQYWFFLYNQKYEPSEISHYRLWQYGSPWCFLQFCNANLPKKNQFLMI